MKVKVSIAAVAMLVLAGVMAGSGASAGADRTEGPRPSTACPERGRSAHGHAQGGQDQARPGAVRNPGEAKGVPDHACRPTRSVELSGAAYVFNVGSRIAGAEVRIAELPDLVTTTAEDGTWSLTVPSGADVTPYIQAEGFRTMHVQTFHTGADDIADINFQTPTTGVHDALAALITAYTGGDPYGDGCGIVTTVSDPVVVGMPFDEFVYFAPHGVAGATAFGTPDLPDPIYFNDHVIPDPNQHLTSGDGGVLWPRVPAGTYEITATHPTVEFSSFTATCVPGRLINANPPWGAHGLP